MIMDQRTIVDIFLNDVLDSMDTQSLLLGAIGNGGINDGVSNKPKLGIFLENFF